jgi:elongation factor P hydroxylase
LDVVVEAGDAVAVSVQNANGVVLLEVLPLQDSVREHIQNALDKGLDEAVVGIAS